MQNNLNSPINDEEDNTDKNLRKICENKLNTSSNQNKSL